MKRQWIGTCVLAAALAATGAAQAAAMDYYLKVEGIEGESAQQEHRNWIDIASFSWGVKNSGSNAGSGGGRVGKLEFSDFSWSQRVDMSIPPMFEHLTQGLVIDKVTLDVVRPGSARARPFFQMIFEEVQLSGLSVEGSGEEPEAALAFGYTKIELIYTPQDPKGGFGREVKGGWDLKSGSSAFRGDPMVMLGLFESGGDVAVAAVREVPEPGTWALFAGGLLLLGAQAARRRRAAAR
jgi:type VI secretion system secreted protein Hcp